MAEETLKDEKRRRGIITLLVVTMIWGLAFVAQSRGNETMGPYTFTMLRCFLAVISLLPVIMLRDRRRLRLGAAVQEQDRGWKDSRLWMAALGIAVPFAIGQNLQQVAMVGTEVGKAGFITAQYIILVPVLGLFVGERLRPVVFFSVGLAVMGLYFLSVNDRLVLQWSDVLLLLCALFFAIQIRLVGRWGSQFDSLRLSCICFLFVGLLTAIPALFYETMSWDSVRRTLPALLYTGIFSSSVAYTLQIVGQKDLDSVTASLIMSLESVFSVLFAFLINGELLTPRELLGCAILFAGILLSQLPERSKEMVVSVESGHVSD